MTIGYLCSYRATEVISHYAIWCMHNYEITVCNLFIRWDGPVIKPTAAAFSREAIFLQKGEREVLQNRWRAAFSWQECSSVLQAMHHPCDLCGFVAPCVPSCTELLPAPSASVCSTAQGTAAHCPSCTQGRYSCAVPYNQRLYTWKIAQVNSPVQQQWFHTGLASRSLWKSIQNWGICFDRWMGMWNIFLVKPREMIKHILWIWILMLLRGKYFKDWDVLVRVDLIIDHSVNAVPFHSPLISI